MILKQQSVPVQKGDFDPLSMYHHTVSFDAKLLNFLSIIEMPKEYKLKERFKKIESTLDPTFRLELIHHLKLKINATVNLEGESEHHYAHPQILLHLWCLLECSDSIEYIANYLELDIEEVKELIRELHNTFSIDSLVSRIRQHYEQNKHLRESYELQKRSELLGIEPILEPKDTNEDRKQRLRRRYGHLSKVFDTMCHTL
jgi:hypothetical protein